MDWYAVNWGSVADWVSGVGSLSAVVTALYLARSSQKVRLRGYCGHRLLVGAGGPTHELVSIVVTNVGNRSTVVSHVGLRVGLLRKRYAFITLVKDQFSEGIPRPLADGEQAHWGIPLDENRSWIADLCKDFITTRLDVETMKIQIHTTNGGTTDIRPEEPLRKMILDVVSKRDH